MRPILTFLSVSLLLGACVSRRQAGDGMLLPDRFVVRYRDDAGVTRRDLAVPSPRVWDALPAVYKDLGFPSAAASSSSGELVRMTPEMTVQGQLYPGELTSTYLDCGMSMARGQRADVFEVTFAIISRVVPVSDAVTRLEIIFDGRARDKTSAGSVVPCNSTGKMESLLLTYLNQRIR